MLCRTLLPFIEELYGKRASALCLSFSYIPALLMKLELLQGMYGFEKKWFSNARCVISQQNRVNGYSQLYAGLEGCNSFCIWWCVVCTSFWESQLGFSICWSVPKSVYVKLVDGIHWRRKDDFIFKNVIIVSHQAKVSYKSCTFFPVKIEWYGN